MALYTLNGANGQLYVYADHIEIVRDGFLAKLTHWGKNKKYHRIDFSEIENVKYRPGILAMSGYFFFKVKGNEQNCNLIEAARHEDCIVFRAYENTTAKVIKHYIDAKT